MGERVDDGEGFCILLYHKLLNIVSGDQFLVVLASCEKMPSYLNEVRAVEMTEGNLKSLNTITESCAGEEFRYQLSRRTRRHGDFGGLQFTIIIISSF